MLLISFCFLEIPVSQDIDLPTEQESGHPEMVALLTALSQVNLNSKYIFGDLLSVSHMLNNNGYTRAFLE